MMGTDDLIQPEDLSGVARMVERSAYREWVSDQDALMDQYLAEDAARETAMLFWWEQQPLGVRLAWIEQAYWTAGEDQA